MGRIAAFASVFKAMAAFASVADIAVSGDAVAMSRLGFVAYGAGVAGITLLFARETIDATDYIFEDYSGDMTALAVTGWVLATFGPIALSVIVWLMATRIRARWLLHLIVIPTAIIVFREGVSLYFYAADIFGESMVSDMSILAATGYLTLAVFVHIIALAALGVAHIRRFVVDR